MMRRLSILFVAAGCALCAAQSADPIVNAICGKTQEQLQSIVDQAAARGKPIEVAAGADKDTLAAAVYASAVAEAPGGGQKTWPGCGSAPEQAAKPATAAKPSAEAGSGEMWAKMSEMLFKTQDKDGDGKLSPTELKKMIDQTNAAAKAQGVADAEVDVCAGIRTATASMRLHEWPLSRRWLDSCRDSSLRQSTRIPTDLLIAQKLRRTSRLS